MKLSQRWLHSFTDALTPHTEEIALTLTQLGIEVEGIAKIGGSFSGVYVGKILSTRPHPNADKLTLCDVTLGAGFNSGNSVQIVCGAQNVREGQLVPVATPGAELITFSGEKIKIKKSKLRGEVSEGMICAEDELGISANHDGIMILDDRFPVGSLFTAPQQPDTIFDISITPNRPDVLSHVGVLRELVGIHHIHYPAVPTLIPTLNSPRVVIEDTEGCPEYHAVVIEGVTVAPSPSWLQERLNAIGLRPINNLVDITNYILHSYGQPMHAFDLSNLSGQCIRVHSHYDGEFTTLDGKKRTIPKGTVMICDQDRPVAIAGVMGGLNSEIKDNTTSILLEVAYFSPSRIRKASKQLGLSTDSSYRFERGIDSKGLAYATAAATALVLELAGGRVIEYAFTSTLSQASHQISVPLKRIEDILGIALSSEHIISLLSPLGFDPIVEPSSDLRVTVPSYRVDLFNDADVIEEIARRHGYDHIPAAETMNASFPQERNPDERFEDVLRAIMIGFGFREVLTNPFMSATQGALIGPSAIATLNPISEEMALLRPTLMHGFLTAVQHNLNRGNRDLRLFEIGHTFSTGSTESAHSESVTGYTEKNVLGFIMTGNRFPLSWSQSSAKVDFYDLKGVAEMLLQRLGILEKATFIPYTASALDIVLFSEEPSKKRIMLARLEVVSSDIRDAFDIDVPVFVGEVDVMNLKEARRRNALYREPSKFPSVTRDLAFLFPVTIASAQVIAMMYKISPLIDEVVLFDVYEYGATTDKKGLKSLAFSLKLISYEKTLTDEVIQNLMDDVVKRVCSEFNATLRSE